MSNSIKPNSNFLNAELENIISDNLSGSDELLLKLNDYFLNNYEKIKFTSDLFDYLNTSFSSFAIVINYLNKLNTIIMDDGGKGIREFLCSYPEKKELCYKKIFSNLKFYLKNDLSIITISNSSTVFETVKLIKMEYEIEKIVICESRPQFEGRILSERIAGLGIKVHLITEANIPKYVELCDFALIGCDKLLSNGNVINKTGSKLLSIICNYFSKPFIVLADSSKISKDSDLKEISKPAEEIWTEINDNITVQNYYFEEIDQSLITEIITDAKK